MEALYRRNPWAATLGLSLVGGMLLFLANLPASYWYFLWLVPAALIVLGSHASRRQLVLAAVVLAIVGSLSLVQVVWSPLLIVVMVLFWSTLFLAILLVIRVACGRVPPLLVALVPPLMLVCWEYLVSFTPIGTALSWAYLHHEVTILIQIADLTGFYGITFIIGFVGSVLGLIATRPRETGYWFPGIVISVVLLALVLGYGRYRLGQPASETVTVAAVHAPDERGSLDTLQGNLRRIDAYRPVVQQCVRHGARIVVWPEMILVLDESFEEALMSELAALSKEHGIWQVIGFYDSSRTRNLLRFVAPDGTIAGEYHKNHLVTLLESSIPGTTPPVVISTELGRIGALICNDDTFTDVGRRLGREGAQIVADPTWDWQEVYLGHARITRFRAVENHYSIIRATQGGLSQLIDSRGTIVAQHLVLANPEQALVAELPLGESRTAYALVGDLFAQLNTLAVVALLIWCAFRRGKAQR